MVLKVALVVDNPLRDLDGLVLLAWQLARQGVEAWLVPMYDQSFDVRAIGADFVLLNYIRPNNIDHFYAYKAEGIKVGVLDTEGIAGRSPEEFAGFVGKTGGAKFADLYCVWGPSQLNALQSANVSSVDKLVLTGCPRYDYCAEPWKKALVRPNVASDYVLINTNFALTNPKFSTGTDTELQTMLKVGFASDVASQFVKDAKVAHEGMIELVQNLVDQFPNEHFVLRPHPFENKEPYLNIKHNGNFEIRQEATSVEWLNYCKALIHLNCSTALEARMLGKVALSPGWLDTETIRIPGPFSVSSHAETLEQFVDLFREVVDPQFSSKQLPDSYIDNLYFRVDGNSAKRVAEAIVNAQQAPAKHNQVLPAASFKSKLILFARNILGYGLSTRIALMRANSMMSEKKKSKLISIDYVRALAERIAVATGQPEKAVEVSEMNSAQLARPHLASGNAIRFSAVL